MPDGRQKEVFFEASDEYAGLVRTLLDAEAVFECEVLQTGEVSLTVEFTMPDGENETLAHEICKNGPEVVEAVQKLIVNANNQLSEIELDQVGRN